MPADMAPAMLDHVPWVQLVQACADSAPAMLPQVPGWQAMQEPSDEAPMMDDHVPAMQFTQPVAPEDARDDDHVPAMQGVQAPLDGVDHVPSLHVRHVVLVEAPVPDDHVPALHPMQSVLAEAARTDDHVPSLQLMQVGDAAKDQVPKIQMSQLLLPDIAHVPALHDEHVSIDEAAATEDHVPGEHAMHEVASPPSVEDQVPGTHAMQLVACGADQVPTPHSAQGRNPFDDHSPAPPAQACENIKTYSEDGTENKKEWKKKKGGKVREDKERTRKERTEGVGI
jgi:hypothetical protein